MHSKSKPGGSDEMAKSESLGEARGRGELTGESGGIHGLWLTGDYKNRRGGVGAHLLRY